MFRYEMGYVGNQQMIVKNPHDHHDLNKLQRIATEAEEIYLKRFATDIGPVEVVVHVTLLKGMKLWNNGALMKDYAQEEVPFPLQMVVDKVVYEDPRFEV
jgi:5'-3' exoribonuclease 1